MSRACGMHTVGLLAPAFLCGSLYTSFQAYWPQLAKDRFGEEAQDGEEVVDEEGPINKLLESISFGAFYLFALFTSLGADATMSKIGRKGTVVLGCIMTVSLAKCELPDCRRWPLYPTLIRAEGLVRHRLNYFALPSRGWLRIRSDHR